MPMTLAGRASAVLEGRHGRFVARAVPVATGKAALAVLAEAGDPVAGRNFRAYRIGTQVRASDDVEPAGTAGRPGLAAIDGRHIDGVAVDATRRYGGIRPGAGGLARAYGGAAQCRRGTPTSPRIARADLDVAFGFDDTGAVLAAPAARGAKRLDERFDGTGARLRMRRPLDRAGALKARLRDATRDRVRLQEAPDA